MLKNPTPEQKAAVQSGHHKIVVSASAGSGKTTTMIARIARIIEMGNSTLDQLLVLTFTDASAKDMRQKLKKELGEKISAPELQAAAIGTFHSFCANIVRSWFTVADVSPSFAILDEVASQKIKLDVLEKVVADCYPQTGQAVDLFAATRRLEDIYPVILHLREFLTTRVDRDAWVKTTALTCYDTDINRNTAIQELIQDYHLTAQWLRDKFTALTAANQQSPLVQFVFSVLTAIAQAQNYEDFHRLGKINFPRLADDHSFPDQASYEEFKLWREFLRDKVVAPLAVDFGAAPTEVQKDIRRDRTVVTQLLTLVAEFNRAYSQKKAEMKKLDFADLEHYALVVLQNPEARERIRAQYKYIFVDEGQDTNPVQFKIIDLLRGDDKFFYIVGDVKQSIYGFRGCEPQLFADLATPAQMAEVLRSNMNFRSNDKILQFANQVFSPLIADYAVHHKFTWLPKATIPAKQEAVKILLATDLAGQMELIYQQIKGSGRAYNEIAILCESTTHFTELRDYLAARGVPSVIDRATDALQEPEIRVLNNFLFAALNPSNELAYYLTLQHLFRCTNDDLAQIKLGSKQVPTIDATLARYRQLARAESTVTVLTMAATEFGLIESPVVEAFLAAIRPVSDFDTVARYLYLVEHERVKVEINVGVKAPDAVRMMTIHHSKGLEFPCVLLFNASDLWTQRDKQNKLIYDQALGVCVLSADPESFATRSNILRHGIMKKQQQITLQEKIRLLYVALTRAKDYLCIVGSWTPTPTRRQAACFLDLINPVIGAPQTVLPSPEQKCTATMAKNKRPQLNKDWSGECLVKQSVTALAAQPEIELDYVAPVKYAGEGGKEFGTAFHRTVQYGALPPVVADLVKGTTIYRELPFLYLQDGMIVQGIMDLLAVQGNSAIIVDYKTTRQPVDKLVALYREQLRLYAQALPGYQVKTYLYSTVHQRLIAVS